MFQDEKDNEACQQHNLSSYKKLSHKAYPAHLPASVSVMQKSYKEPFLFLEKNQLTEFPAKLFKSGNVILICHFFYIIYATVNMIDAFWKMLRGASEAALNILF